MESHRTPREVDTIVRELGKYRLLAEIGRGGMGEVYLAVSRGPAGFRKLVVLKCMNATAADDVHLRRMFLDEALLAARLSHHNVVQTYETGELDGTPYIAMEYLEGQPVSRLTQACPEMDPRMAAHVISDALAGLHYAHQLKDFDGTPLAIVHRDLSPPNIFVTYDGIVKVVDFGVAKTALASRTKTDTGTFKGKISYMAPEQAMHEDVDHRADIFSMGAVLWELLAGKRLFREISPALTLKRILHDEVPPPSSARPGIDPALDAIVGRALQRNPNERYASALQMRQDLQRFLCSGEARNWDAELGALVSEKFAKQRQKVQRQVQLCMNEESERRGELPKVNLTDTASGVSASSEGRVSGEARTGTATEASVTGSGGGVFRFGLDAPVSATPAQAPAPSPERRRVGVVLLFAVLAAGAAIAAWIAFSSEDGAALQATRAHSVSAPSASLEILSTPPGAVIFVDGEPSGLFTPAVLKGLRTGRSVVVRIDKAGYQAQEERISLGDGQALRRSFRLLESEGLIRLIGAPADARVYVDEVLVAENTTGPITISVGSHKIRVETASALVFSQVIQVVPGEQTLQVAGTRSTQ